MIDNYISAALFKPDSPFSQDYPSSKADFSDIKILRVLPFVYKGASFSSLSDGTLFHPIGTTSFRGQTIEGDYSLIIRSFVTSGNSGFGGNGFGPNNQRWKNGYWITAESSSLKTSIPLQIRFDKNNAQKFIDATNNIYGTNMSFFR